MGLCNIQHPKTKMWRQWSTYTDEWASEWMSEDDYKTYLVKQAAEQMQETLDTFGIQIAQMLTQPECDYVVACHEHCKECPHDHCDDCKYSPWAFDTYKKQGDDYLNVGLNN